MTAARWRTTRPRAVAARQSAGDTRLAVQRAALGQANFTGALDDIKVISIVARSAPRVVVNE